jgi:hypothetical protein
MTTAMAGIANPRVESKGGRPKKVVPYEEPAQRGHFTTCWNTLGVLSLTPCFSGVFRAPARHGTVSTVSTRSGKPLKRFPSEARRNTQLKQGVNNKRSEDASNLHKLSVNVSSARAFF